MRADLYTAPLLFLLGVAMAYGGWTMDRLEIRQIHPASIPGLVPMLLGVVLAIVSAILFIQARGQVVATAVSDTPEQAAEPVTGQAAGSRRDLIVAALLCGTYALGLIGRVPFPVATGLFVAAFVIAFEAHGNMSRAQLVKVCAIGAGLGIAVATAISVLFRYAFLVRLP